MARDISSSLNGRPSSLLTRLIDDGVPVGCESARLLPLPTVVVVTSLSSVGVCASRDLFTLSKSVSTITASEEAALIGLRPEAAPLEPPFPPEVFPVSLPDRVRIATS